MILKHVSEKLINTFVSSYDRIFFLNAKKKSFELVMSYLKNIGSGVYDFEARFRKAYQHLCFAFPKIRMNLCVVVTAGAFWGRLISLKYAQTVTSAQNSPSVFFR